MIEIITGASIAMFFFVVPILAYREGIRVGMQLNKGIEPPALKSPIQVVKEIKQEREQSKSEKKLSSDIDIMMNYSGGDTDDGLS